VTQTIQPICLGSPKRALQANHPQTQCHNAFLLFYSGLELHHAGIIGVIVRGTRHVRQSEENASLSATRTG
jgi:hypothetical protein